MCMVNAFIRVYSLFGDIWLTLAYFPCVDIPIICDVIGLLLSLDTSKAFNRVILFKLFSILLKKGFPVIIGELYRPPIMMLINLMFLLIHY